MSVRLVDVYLHGEVDWPALQALYDLLAERDPVANISHRELPSFEAHQVFVMFRPYRAWFLIIDDAPRIVGAIYATDKNEIGISIFKASQKRGVGGEAVRALIAKLSPLGNGPWLANIAPGNAVSQFFFEKLGFRHIQNTYALQPAGGEPHGNQRPA